MPLAPAIVAALSLGLPARTKGLYVDGLDVLREPGAAGGRYGVDIETIQLVEQGYGQVSSLSFTIDDPAGVVSITDGATVRFQDITRNVPLFLGYVETFSPVALGPSRAIEVTCIGIESVLDWMVLPTAVTFPIGALFEDAVASVVALSTGIGAPLKVASRRNQQSNQEFPTALSGVGVSTLQGPVTVPAGTLRQALQTLAAAWIAAFDPGGVAFLDVPASVDFYGGLRMAHLTNPQTANGWRTVDYATLTVSVAAARAPSGTQHTTDASGAVRGVWVNGGSAPGTGLVMDGTGKPGPIAVVSEPNSTTAESRLAAALAYMGSNSVLLSGEVTLEETANAGAAGAEYRAGGKMTITDANLGVTARTYIMASIAKSFTPSGSEVWTITYGATAKGSQFIRQLTRSTLS